MAGGGGIYLCFASYRSDEVAALICFLILSAEIKCSLCLKRGNSGVDVVAEIYVGVGTILPTPTPTPAAPNSFQLRLRLHDSDSTPQPWLQSKLGNSSCIYCFFRISLFPFLSFHKIEYREGLTIIITIIIIIVVVILLIIVVVVVVIVIVIGVRNIITIFLVTR